MSLILAGSACFPWLPERGEEMLGACFDLERGTMAPGESCETQGRIGILLEGDGTLNDRESAGPGTVFGACRSGPWREKIPAEETFLARTDCTVAWFRFDVVTAVCYNACWFHARLIQELDRMLDAREREE